MAENAVLGPDVTLETIEVTHFDNQGHHDHQIEIVDREFIGSSVPVDDLIILTRGDIEDI